MRKLSNIFESAWGEMRKRSAGEQVRKEDEFNPEYVDLGEDTTVYWAIDNLEIDDEIMFTFDEVKDFNRDGWRLPTAEEVKQISWDLPVTDIPKGCIIFPTSTNPFDRKNQYELKLKRIPMVTSGITNLWTSDHAKFDSELVLVFGFDNTWKFDFRAVSPETKHPVFLVKDKKKVNESAWGEMRKRSSGDQVRREDDINNLDLDGMWDYLNDNYDIDVNAMPLKSKNDTSSFISYPMFIIGHALYRIDLQFINDKISEIQLEANNKNCSEFIDSLKVKYDIDDNGGFGMIKIHSKTDKLTNQDAIDIINTIIDNSTKPAIKRKENS